MAALTSLPTELLEEIVSHLPVNTLIALRSVSHRFRAICKSSIIRPNRRRLLALFDKYVSSPTLLSTDMPRNYSDIPPMTHRNWMALAEPEEFGLWLLEFPRMAIDCQFLCAVVYPRSACGYMEGSTIVSNYIYRLYVGPDPDTYVRRLEGIDATTRRLANVTLQPEGFVTVLVLILRIFASPVRVCLFLNGAGKRNGSVWTYPNIAPIHLEVYRDTTLTFLADSWIDWLEMHFQEHMQTGSPLP